MSQAERSFLKAAFHGVIAEELLAHFPKLPPEQAPEVERLLAVLTDLGRAGQQPEPTVDGELPEGWLDAVAQAGLFGTMIPKEYGGLGLGRLADARIHEALGRLDPALAITVGAHSGLATTALMRAGTKAQQSRLLPSMARGDRLAAFALTEPGMGSDAAATETHAELATDGGGYVLHGHKLWVTNGGRAELVVVFARTTPADRDRKPALTAFLVEPAPGVQVGPEIAKVGVRGASTTSLRLDHARVPADALLGALGRGFMIAVEALNEGRIQVAARCLGVARRALERATERALSRHAFGRPLAGFQMVQERLADQAAQVYALQCMCTLTAGLADSGMPDYSLESAACKVFGSETALAVTDSALRIAGGVGYIEGQGWERAVRDARADLLLEGTNEVMRAFIALSGMRSPGAQMVAVERAMREPIKGFGVLSDFALSRARSVLGRERLSVAHPLLKREAVHLEEAIGGLGTAADRLLRRYGPDIAEEQMILGRIADAAIQIWALAATLSRTTAALVQSGEGGAARELALAGSFGELAHRRIQRALGELDDEADDLRVHVADELCQAGGRLPSLP